MYDCHSFLRNHSYETNSGYFYNVFDVRLIWATSLFDLVGGGKIVFDSLTLAIIAEDVPASSL